MNEISERLFIGSDSDHRTGDDEWAVIHACKSPCHQNAVGYRGSLPASHPHYLVLEKAVDLYLNIIDPPRPLFKPPLFSSFREFATHHWGHGKKILMHCNQGESRAPSLGLLFLAKRKGEFSNQSYADARAEFEVLYPFYRPGQGIQIYLDEHWDTL